MAQEMGATFEIMGKRAVFVPRNASASAGRKDLPVVMADYGRNIIGWQIRPLQNRPRYDRSVVRWYDSKEAKWRKETAQLMDEAERVPLPGKPATGIGREIAPTVMPKGLSAARAAARSH